MTMRNNCMPQNNQVGKQQKRYDILPFLHMDKNSKNLIETSLRQTNRESL